ncbi:MAG: AI-2E family transporter [Gammaproteobacteria bacterium]|nr:AI-2E family transporter [Gammaproteobacteria bacterium]MDH5592821.1 AI-2E family transporter [Gammaproteobacteria bacterium]MDH5613864.1 AI-2E family transporter [Gammaproteobacteria bacterium]
MTDIQKGIVLIAVAFSGWLVYLLAPVLTPFMISILLAYVGDPIVDRLEARRLPRTLAVIIVFLGLFILGIGLLLVLAPVLEKQLAAMFNRLPSYIDWIQLTAMPYLFNLFGIENVKLDVSNLKQMFAQYWQQAGGIAATMIGSVSRSGFALIGWIANLVLVPVVTFYLLRDWDKLMDNIKGLFPRKQEQKLTQIACESDEVLGAFFRGQFLVMLALGTVYATGLSIIGIEMALLIGLLAGLVSFVPYLGFIVGIVVAGLVTLVQFQAVEPLVYVLVVFGIGQLLEGFLLTPWLVGDRIGLHPVAVIFAVLAGGQLFGFLGVLLALPVAAVIMVLLRHLHQSYVNSELYE